MNHEKLLDVLEDMHYAALLPHAEFHIDATKEELSEALKQLRELVERDTSKKTTVEHDGEYSEAYCPNCHEFLDSACIGDFCTECGQRLDWSEYWSE